LPWCCRFVLTNSLFVNEAEHTKEDRERLEGAADFLRQALLAEEDGPIESSVEAEAEQDNMAAGEEAYLAAAAVHVQTTGRAEPQRLGFLAEDFWAAEDF